MNTYILANASSEHCTFESHQKKSIKYAEGALLRKEPERDTNYP